MSYQSTQDYIDYNPTINQKEATYILKSHGFTPADYLEIHPNDSAPIVEAVHALDKEWQSDTINTQELFNWLGY